jgi:hypothetical protein
MQRIKTYKILTLILVMQWAFVQLIAQFPNVVEKYYANGLYQYISKLMQFLFGWIPFSVGDVLYGFVIIVLLFSAFKLIRNKKVNFKHTFFKIGAIASVVFFVFHINWGLNYLKPSLYKSLDLKQEAYTDKELIDFTKLLITNTNDIHFSITKNDTVVVRNEFSKIQIQENAYKAYKQLQQKHPQFTHGKISIKHSLFSVPLTYMGFAGYLNPITNEAQVNYLLPKNSYPATVCHELAHKIGIASESEANFVGFLAAKNSKDVFFNYAGNTMALRYCLAEIYRKQPNQFELLLNEINKGILKDLQESKAFWESYQNWTEKYFKTFYDFFLKANKQEEGIKGYNKMVSLLISYYNSEKYLL